MFSNRFGIEIEFTGITRNRAAKIAAGYLRGPKLCALGFSCALWSPAGPPE